MMDLTETQWVRHTVTHPVEGFNDMRWKKSGSLRIAFLIVLLLFFGEIADDRLYGATAIEALKCVPSVKTILIGGMDRGIDYKPLVDFLKKKDVNIICMEASGKRVYDMICGEQFPDPERVYCVAHLDEAVKLASEITGSGESCVMSPAAASYGIFKNFEELFFILCTAGKAHCLCS